MVQNRQEMKLKIGLSIFKINLLVIMGISCSPNEQCHNFKVDDYVIKILHHNDIKADSTILINEYVKINDIYSLDIENIRKRGFYEFDCSMSDELRVQSIAIQDMTPEIFSSFSIIELSQPFYSSTENKIAVITSTYCGNNCGTIDLYFLVESENGWNIGEIKSLGQM